MRSLKNVQIASKVLKILTQIAFVFSIVGCSISALGLIIVSIFGNNQAIMDLFIKIDGSFDLRTAVCVFICGMIECGFMIALYACTIKFYKKELSIGTPFDTSVVKSCRKLGWIYIILSCSSFFVIGVVGTFLHVDVTSYMSAGDVTLGIVYLIVSLVFAYGAELKTKSENAAITPADKSSIETKTENAAKISTQSTESKQESK